MGSQSEAGVNTCASCCLGVPQLRSSESATEAAPFRSPRTMSNQCASARCTMLVVRRHCSKEERDCAGWCCSITAGESGQAGSSQAAG